MPFVLFYIFPCVYVAGCCLKDELYNATSCYGIVIS
jgi:hypothetical protein